MLIGMALIMTGFFPAFRMVRDLNREDDSPPS
jgi:hypothetical protein